MLQIYRTKAFEYTHENSIADELSQDMKILYDESSENVILLFNYKDMDAVVIRERSVAVIDFKNYWGEITTYPTDANWYINTDTLCKGGSKINPYQQIRCNKFTLMNILKPFVNGDVNLGHISGILLFQNQINNLKELNKFYTSSANSIWFKVVDIENYSKVLHGLSSPQININKDLMMRLPNLLQVEGTLIYQSCSVINNENLEIAKEQRLDKTKINILETKVADLSNSLIDLMRQKESFKHQLQEQKLENERIREEVIPATPIIEDNNLVINELNKIKVEIENLKPRNNQKSMPMWAIAATFSIVVLIIALFTKTNNNDDSKTDAINYLPVKSTTQTITAMPNVAIREVKILDLVNPDSDRKIRLRDAPDMLSTYIEVGNNTTVEYLRKTDIEQSINIKNRTITDVWVQVKFCGKTYYVFGYYLNHKSII